MRKTWRPTFRTSWSASSLAVIKRRRSGGCTSLRAMEPALLGRGAEGDCHGAGGHLRAGLPSLLIRLQAVSLCSSSLASVAYWLHEPRAALGDRSRYRKILRFDFALPPACVS